MYSFAFQILNSLTFASTSTTISVDTGRYILDIYPPCYSAGTKAYLRPLVFLSLERLRLTCATAVGAGRLDAYPCSASEKYKKGVASDDDAFLEGTWAMLTQPREVATLEASERVEIETHGQGPTSIFSFDVFGRLQQRGYVHVVPDSFARIFDLKILLIRFLQLVSIQIESSTINYLLTLNQHGSRCI